MELPFLKSRSSGSCTYQPHSTFQKLEERGYLRFSKRLNDKRNTYVQLTEEGTEVFWSLLEEFDPTRNAVFKGSQPLYHLFGKFPEVAEMMCMIRHIYGDDFMEIFETSLTNIDNDFESVNGKLKKKQRTVRRMNRLKSSNL